MIGGGLIMFVLAIAGTIVMTAASDHGSLGEPESDGKSD
jgi:hypothetical protein